MPQATYWPSMDPAVYDPDGDGYVVGLEPLEYAGNPLGNGVLARFAGDTCKNTVTGALYESATAGVDTDWRNTSTAP